MVYTIIVEKGEKGYSAYAPDVLGCVAAGDTVEEVVDLMSGALRFHLEGMLEDGESIPQPRSMAFSVHIDMDTETNSEAA
ncbi:MAG: type II toxin-antitoxin system HicB family antitoxin [Armatimonadetes bacterium]|nr:type II toxin-antitoxin system HicB family antitoxin [Armatimonadota bacterium]